MSEEVCEDFREYSAGDSHLLYRLEKVLVTVTSGEIIDAPKLGCAPSSLVLSAIGGKGVITIALPGDSKRARIAAGNLGGTPIKIEFHQSDGAIGCTEHLDPTGNTLADVTCDKGGIRLITMEFESSEPVLCKVCYEPEG